MLSRFDTMPPSGSTSWSYLLCTWRGCRLSGASWTAAGASWHSVNFRLTRTLWEAEKGNFICVRPCSLEHGKLCWKRLLTAYMSYQQKARYFPLGSWALPLLASSQRNLPLPRVASEDFIEGVLLLSEICIPYIHEACVTKQKRQKTRFVLVVGFFFNFKLAVQAYFSYKSPLSSFYLPLQPRKNSLDSYIRLSKESVLGRDDGGR